MRRVSVIVPTQNQTLLTRLLRSLFATHDELDGVDVFVVDDGLESQPFAEVPSIHYLKGIRPFCYARNVNLGINAAPPASDIFLANDDTAFFTRNALATLGQAIDDDTSLGIVAPAFTSMEKNPNQRVGSMDPGCGLWIEKERSVTFASAYIRRRLIAEIGALDEGFTGYGYEDDDYCWRSRAAGYALGILPSVLMMHGDAHGRTSSTFRNRPNLLEMFAHNREYFVAKWVKQLLPLDDAGVRVILDLIGRL